MAGNRGLERADVTAVLQQREQPYRLDVDGYYLEGAYGNWMIRAGSGIAGRGGHVFLWELTTGEKSETVDTRAGLRRILDHCPGAICRTCKGRGQIEYRVPNGFEGQMERNCRMCKGKGAGRPSASAGGRDGVRNQGIPLPDGGTPTSNAGTGTGAPSREAK